jgi:hypothetical protein
MAFTLEKVVPWGRSFDEYRRMFALTDAELAKRILGCADGPASINAELTASGGSIVSFDPIYEFSADEIRLRIDTTYPQMIEQTRQNIDEFVWTADLPDPDALGRRRRATMNCFLRDYESGGHEERYITANLPALPFADDSFDLAVCSHFLFLYSEQLSEQFHVESIRSLMRVAMEARVFPLLELGAKPSRHVESVAMALQSEGYRIDIEVVNYEFQRDGNQMMRITR